MYPIRKNLIDKSREHQANERTFLAWIRTGIALMGFGFVIVKFSLFLNEISILLKTNPATTKSYSSLVGVIMVALGVIISALAYWEYKKVEHRLKQNVYYPASVLSLFTTLVIIIGGIVLIVYLLSII